MWNLFSSSKSAFPREKYARRNHSVNRYWDAEDAGRRPRRRFSEPDEEREAPELIHARMRKPVKVRRDRGHRLRRKMTPRQIVRMIALSAASAAVIVAAITAVVFVPNLPSVLRLRAEHALQNGSRTEACELYTRLLEQCPDDTSAALALADVLAETDVPAAIELLRQYENGNPDAAERLAKLVPTASLQPEAGEYSGVIVVTPSCGRTDVSVRYTTDGSEPTVDSPVLSDGIELGEGETTVRILPVAENGAVGEMTGYTYTVTLRTPEKPTALPAPGSYSQPTRVELSVGNADDMICYTTNGSEPTAESAVYRPVKNGSGGIFLTGGVNTVRAVAVSPEGKISETAVFRYDLTAVPQASVFFDCPGGSYEKAVILHLIPAAEGVTLYYTTNSDTPVPGTDYTFVYHDMLFLSAGFAGTVRVLPVGPDGSFGEISEQSYVIGYRE